MLTHFHTYILNILLYVQLIIGIFLIFPIKIFRIQIHYKYTNKWHTIYIYIYIWWTKSFIFFGNWKWRRFKLPHSTPKFQLTDERDVPQDYMVINNIIELYLFHYSLVPHYDSRDITKLIFLWKIRYRNTIWPKKLNL